MLTLLGWLLGCAPRNDPPPVVPAPVWPAAGAVHPLPPPDRTAGPPVRLLLDAGHGAVDNGGNTNVWGERERDVMRRIVDGVAASFPAPVPGEEHLVVTRTRTDDAFVPYNRRVTLANASDLLISLHSDARAGTRQGWMNPLAETWWTEGAAGFAILWSDEGEAALVGARHALACGLARNMTAVGFLPYPGADYPGLYAPDDTVPGVFVDRHVPRQRILLLRRPAVPSVIVETHEAHDRDEVARWEEPETWRAFASVVEATVAEAVEATAEESVPTAGAGSTED